MADQPDPFRLKLMRAVRNAIREITPSNDYYHDLSACTFIGRYWFGASDPLPLVSILESPEPRDQEDTPETGVTDTGPVDLIIQGFVQDDDDPEERGANAYKLMAEVRQRLYRERQKFERPLGYNRFGMGTKISGMNIGRGIVRPPDDVSDKDYFWLPMRLIVVENGLDPYT